MILFSKIIWFVVFSIKLPIDPADILIQNMGQGEFQEQLLKIHERARSKEEEIEGGWYTEERMEKDLGYSKFLALFFLFGKATSISI